MHGGADVVTTRFLLYGGRYDCGMGYTGLVQTVWRRSHHVRGEATGHQTGHRGIHGERWIRVTKPSRRDGVHVLALLWHEPSQRVCYRAHCSRGQRVIRRELRRVWGPGDSCFWVEYFWREVRGGRAGGEVFVAVGDERRQRMDVVGVLHHWHFVG